MNSSDTLGRSPMMLAYASAEKAAPDHFVLYRVGEFYEVLGRNAEAVSRLLGIQLTHRRQKDAKDVPMCGIPAGTSDQAIARLLAQGHKVAVSDPSPEDGAERQLCFLTHATSVAPDVLSVSQSNNLAVAYADGPTVAFAWIDLSTGDSGTTTSSLDACGAALARIGPTEILVARWPEGSKALAVAIHSSAVKPQDVSGKERTDEADDAAMLRVYGNAWRDRIRGLQQAEVTAFAILLDYILTTVGRLPDALPPPRQMRMGDTMHIDAPTLRGLEVLTSASGREGSLLSAVDRTVTSPGARLLARQLAAPLTNLQQIGQRQSMVRFLNLHPKVRADCREDLSAAPDMLRACGRLSLGKGSPRDLADVRDGLHRAATMAERLGKAGELPTGLASVMRDLGLATGGDCGAVGHALRRGLIAQPPARVQDRGYIANGYETRLDAARTEAVRARQQIEELEARYVIETGLKSLRIRVNSLVGYHIEVPSKHGGSLGQDFVLRQGLASTTRFRTAELDTLAAHLNEVTDAAIAVEQAVFTRLSNKVLDVRETLTRVSHAMAALDVVAGLAQAAAEGLWIEPELVDNATIAIEAGRHPVAEQLLADQGRTFVANDCQMTQRDRLWLLTGPNMAGKSTFLRQVALIVLMAQIGSFVPASHARIGVVDKLFSRIGSADDLAAGRSTFLVEMLETAAILNQATNRSLVILDEVGRGTSTQDGLAIAQATMEHLHDQIESRTLFATHFHELADAADNMAHARCMAMDASEGEHGDVFSFKIIPGRGGQSYGLRAAALAGLPTSVLTRASELLSADNS